MLYPIELRVHLKEWPNLEVRVAKINRNFSAPNFSAPSMRGAHLDSATVRKRMGVVALAVPSQLGAASPSAGDSRRYNGGSVKMHRSVRKTDCSASLLPRSSEDRGRASAR